MDLNRHRESGRTVPKAVRDRAGNLLTSLMDKSLVLNRNDADIVTALAGAGLVTKTGQFRHPG